MRFALWGAVSAGRWSQAPAPCCALPPATHVCWGVEQPNISVGCPVVLFGVQHWAELPGTYGSIPHTFSRDFLPIQKKKCLRVTHTQTTSQILYHQQGRVIKQDIYQLVESYESLCFPCCHSLFPLHHSSDSRSASKSGKHLLWATGHHSKLRNYGTGGGLWPHSHKCLTELRF